MMLFNGGLQLRRVGVVGHYGLRVPRMCVVVTRFLVFLILGAILGSSLLGSLGLGMMWLPVVFFS